jgi:phosphoglycerol transferase MdoB-like AlkP superfamily enzyme
MPTAQPTSPLTSLIRPLGVFLVLALGVLTVSRTTLAIGFVRDLGPLGELPRLYVTGLRFDLLWLSYLLAPVWILLCLTPAVAAKPVVRVVRVYLTVMLAVMVVLEIASWPALREYGSRPEAHFLEFVGHPNEVLGMLLGGFPAELLAGVVAAALIAALGWWALRRLRHDPWPSTGLRLLLLPLGAALLFLGARSSLGHRAANLSTASFSQNRLHNELALNSSYTLMYAVYRRKHDASAERDYGTLPPERILELVTSASGWPPESMGGASGPTWHQQEPRRPGTIRPPNVVIILLESLGAEYTGSLGGTRLTPHLDLLSQEGLRFEQLYSTGTRTSRGIEAVLSGFFPSPARSVLKLGLSQHDFFTAPGLFRSAGYSTHFIYGGEANFDEMKAFMTGNGVEHVWDQPRLQKPDHAVGVWGIHDEDLLQEADDLFRAQGDQPFFAVVLTTSNHTPFDYPAGRITPDPAYSAASVENAIKYTDHALGQFFARARAAAYFDNTLFLLVADHGTRISGDQLIPVHKFHIPGIILGPPDLVPKEAIRCRASQVDLMPTLLALTGRTWQHPMVGCDLFRLTAAERANPAAGRALLQYETHYGYWEGPDMVILRPDLPPAQFHLAHHDTTPARGYHLEPQALVQPLAERALAHALLPGYLYRNRLYRLSGPLAAEVNVSRKP